MSFEDKELNRATEAEETESNAQMIGLEDEELFQNSTVFSAPAEKKEKKKKGSKKTRNIIAAVVLAVILAGSVFAIVKFIPTMEENGAEGSSSVVSTLDMAIKTLGEDDLTGVTFENENGKFTAIPVASSVTDESGNVTKEINWYLEGVDQSLTDTDLLNALIDHVTTLKAVRTMEEDVESLAEYGLDDPVITVTAVGDKGYTLLLGDDSPAGDGKYAIIKGENTVYLIDSTIVNSFDNGATSYVSVQAMTSLAKTDGNADYFDADGLLAKVDHMTIGGTAHATPIRIEMNPYDATSYIPYIMTSPVKQNVLGETGDKVMSPLKSGLMADAVYEINPDAATVAKYGLNQPLVTIEYKVGEYTAKISLANAPSEPNYYAMMVDGKPLIYKMLKSEMAFAEYTPDQFFNNYIFLDDIGAVQSLSVTTSSGTRVYNLTHGVAENEEATLAVAVDGKTLDTEDFRSLYQYMITCYASEFTMEAAPEGVADLTIVVDYVDDARPNLTVAYKKATDRRYHVTVDGVPLGYAFLNTVDNLIENETKYYNGEDIPKP